MLLLRKNVLDVLRDDTRLLLFEEHWSDGHVFYLHVAPRAPVRAGHIESRLRWLNLLMDSVSLVLSAHGFPSMKQSFRIGSRTIDFGRLMLKEIIVVFHPSIETARRVIHSSDRRLSMSVSEFDGFPM